MCAESVPGAQVNNTEGDIPVKRKKLHNDLRLPKEIQSARPKNQDHH